jgi:ribose-phosphate pyrophosphokinase
MESEIKIFSGSQSQYLASKIAEKAGESLGKLEVIRFSDGEFQPIIHESIRGSFFFIIQSTFPPSDNLMELLMIVDAAKRASARYIIAVIPYFGFARQDRKDRPRVAIGAKLVADLLETAGVTRLITMDLHAGQIQGFFNIPVDHLSSSVIFYNYIESLGLEDLTFASPDVGSTNRARTFAQHFNANLVICDKHRKRPNEIAAMTVIGDVQDQNVIIVDDLVDTAGTLCNAAQLLIDKGAKSVRALITHPVMSGKAYERITDSVLTELVVCNTIPLKADNTLEKIKVLSVDKIFATAIRNAYEFKSINSLFV